MIKKKDFWRDNIGKNKNVNNNHENKKNNDESEPSSAKSKSSKKSSISDNKLERSIYSPDVANMEGINILGVKDETQASCLEDDLEVVFLGYLDILNSDLKEFFKNIASEEKENIDYKLLSRKVTAPSKTILVFCKSIVIYTIFWPLYSRIKI